MDRGDEAAHQRENCQSSRTAARSSPGREHRDDPGKANRAVVNVTTRSVRTDVHHESVRATASALTADLGMES